MIKIEKLTKKYKSKKGLSCYALKNVSFTLKDTGMVFVVGKSGCGKTTLLNLIGGLDNITSGTIIADGNDLSSFNNEQYDAYRNSYFGFVFQDFYLLDDLTVFDNVKLALDIQNKDDDEEEVLNILKEVGLEGLENRYPEELSGGQKQRVAIARALIKKPKLILADEPTGNLDSKTSIQILQLLKNLSKEYLVLIVSHNVLDANTYADRIIELSDGEIVKDVTKEEEYNNILTFENNILSLPHSNQMSREELNLIKEYCKKYDVKEIVQKTDGFYEIEPIECVDNKLEFKSPKISRKNKYQLSSRLFKNERTSSILTSIIVGLFLVILGLCQTLTGFDRKDVINSSMKPDDFIVRKVGYDNQMNLVELEIDKTRQEIMKDNEEKIFLEKGYEGKYFFLYNYSSNICSFRAINYQHYLTPNTFAKNFYSETDYGTLVCDYEFLLEKFGNENNELTYVGDLYDNPTGIILTDYMADSIIYTTGQYLTYESMLGQNNYSYINAIIDTGYKVRHKETIETFTKLLRNNGSKQEQTNFFSSEEYAVLSDEIEQYLGINYSLNQNFKSEINGLNMDANYSLRNTVFTINGQSSKKIDYLSIYNEENITSNISSGEILMGYSEYNSLFGTQYTLSDLDTFTPHSVKIECYNGNNIYYSKEFFIAGLRKYSGCYMKYDDFNEYVKTTIFKTGIYFDDPSLTDKLYDVAIDNAFQPVSIYYDSIYEINKGISVVRTLFLFISVVLLIACLLFLISYSVTSVRKKRVEIGILRGLGMTNKDLYDVYICQFLKIGLIISVVLTIGLIISSQFANILLQEGFASLMKLTFIKSIKIVKFDIEVLLIDIGILFAILLVSLIFPIIKLRKIKPLNIIKS